MDNCVDCRKPLTPEEKYYYGISCTMCEIKDMVESHAPDLCDVQNVNNADEVEESECL